MLASGREPKPNVLDPATARFWCSLRYPDFLVELGASFDKITFDRDAWSSLFSKNAYEIRLVD